MRRGLSSSALASRLCVCESVAPTGKKSMAFRSPTDAIRLGQALKRLMGQEPVRFRFEKDETRFLLVDCSDAAVGALVRDKRCLQLAGGETTPLVIDIDSLHPGGKKAASEAAFASERLQCATRLIGVVLRARYKIEIHWFSSGKQGVHGWAFGVQLTRSTRQLIAGLMPQGASDTAATISMFEHHPAYSHEDVKVEVEAGLSRLRTLDNLHDCGDTEWLGRLRAAMEPNAPYATKLLALTAFFDVGVTISTAIRLPCAFNQKGCGYAGFPLPPPSLESAWPPLQREASVALTTSELDMISTIVIPTAAEREATLKALKVDVNSRKRTHEEAASASPSAYIPRLYPRRVALPTDPSARMALIPRCVRARLPMAAIEALEQGMKRGGMPLCDWIAEPNDDHRRDASARGGGAGDGTLLPLALDALIGLHVTPKARGNVARSLIASAFPVDCFAAAMKASGKMHRLEHWASWFDTFAKGKGKTETPAWRYDAGRLEAVGMQCPNVRSQCARAAALLNPKGAAGGGGKGCKTRTRPAASCPSRPNTGRVVEIVLPESKEVVLDEINASLKERAAAEATTTEAAADQRLEALVKKANDSLTTLYNLAGINGVVEFTEYISTEGRFGYSSGRFDGIKSVLREVRAAIFKGAWRVDLKRCHTSMLLGAYNRAATLGIVQRHPLLDRMCGDLGGVENDLSKDQTRLLPIAMERLQSAMGTVDEKNAARLVGYLQSKPKTLLSAMLNHPNESPMFKTWPLAASCCRALGVAATAARSHPLVAADQHRPEICNITLGSAKEKQRIAFILERRAVSALVVFLEQRGLMPSLTINDEVLFFPPAGTDGEALWRDLTAEVERVLGFKAPLCVDCI